MHARTAVTNVDVQQDPNLDSRCFGSAGQQVYLQRMADSQEQLSALTDPMNDPADLCSIDDWRRQKHAPNAGRYHRLRLGNRCHAYAVCPSSYLPAGNLRALVRLGMRPEPLVRATTVIGHLTQIVFKCVQIQYEGRCG
jgi:hypothetical protein